MTPARRSILAGAAVAVVVAGGLLSSPERVFRLARSTLYDPWFPVLLVGLYVVRPFLAWPISALSVLVGYRYGLVVGFPVAMVGVVGTSLIPYAGARYVRSGTGLLGRATDGSERYFDAVGDLRGVVAARLAPVPAEVISSAAGFGNVRPRAFVAGTAIGEIPWTAAAVLAGHSLERFTVAGVDAVDLRLVAAGLLAGALLLAGPVYRRLHRRSIDDLWPRRNSER